VDPDDQTITDGYGSGEGADVGSQDPITGLPAGDTNADLDSQAQLDDAAAEVNGLPDDPEEVQEERLQTVTDDAVAGDTVFGGIGETNQGPTGGAPHEFQPGPTDPVFEGLPENELRGQDIDLDEENRTLDR